MEIFKSILPVLFFIVINSAISLTLKKGFGKTLPFIFIISTLIIFLSQVIFKTFNIGIYILLAIFVISLYLIIKNRNNKKYIFTNGFYVFISLCLIFLFIDFGRHFFWDDEVGFWGKMVKELFRLDKFYYLNESALRGHNDYPPFIPLFEFLWCKLSFGYSECNCTFALHIFEFSLLVPNIFDTFFEKKSKFEKALIDLLISLSFVGVVVYLDACDVFNTIYVDTAVAMEFAYAIYLVYSEEIENYFGIACFGLIMLVMIMTKQVALAFCLLAALYYVANNIKSFKNKKIFIGLLIGIALPIIGYFGWNTLIKPYDIVKQFDFSKISLSGMKEILKGGSFHFEAIRLYINALFKKNLYNYPIPVTFLSSLILEILLLELIKRFVNKDAKVFTFELTCFVGTAGYALLMLVLYAFCYPEREALRLISYDRYMSSFTAGIFISIAIIFIYNIKNKIEKIDVKSALLISLIMLCLFNYNRLLDFVPQIILGNRYSSFENVANRIDQNIEKGSSIFIVYSHDDVDDYPAFMSYFSDETYYTKRNMDLCGEDYSDITLYNQTLDELKQYDYIYVANYTKSFENYFGFMFESNIKTGLYKVNNKDNTIYLEFVCE